MEYGGYRYFYFVVNAAVTPCDSNWVDDKSGCTPVVTCTGGFDLYFESDPDPDNDADGDGVNSDTDCDDNEPLAYPGNTEVLYDGIDNDCNPATLDDDLDQDGFLNAVDCNDNDAAVNPEATEICHDAIDNDCDGFTDEDDAACGEVISYCNADQTKVLICHNGKNKCVQINALDAHLAHGDTLGSCDGDPYDGDLYTKSKKGKTETSILGFTTRVWPNPLENNFNIKIATADNLNGVDVQVIDITGKRVHNAHINWNENYKFGSKLESGVYFVKITQGNNTQVKKVIKR